MLISQKNQIGFIHIPKCGGSTIKHQFATMAVARKVLTRGGSRYKGFARREPAIADFVQGYYARDLELCQAVAAGQAA